MRHFRVSWTSTLAKLGLKRAYRKPKRDWYRRRSMLETLEERRVLSNWSLLDHNAPMGPIYYVAPPAVPHSEDATSTSAALDIAPDHFSAEHFTLTSDDWSGKPAGGRINITDRALGVDSGKKRCQEPFQRIYRGKELERLSRIGVGKSG